jgi:hypothetical protein
VANEERLNLIVQVVDGPRLGCQIDIETLSNPRFPAPKDNDTNRMCFRCASGRGVEREFELAKPTCRACWGSSEFIYPRPHSSNYPLTLATGRHLNAS